MIQPFHLAFPVKNIAQAKDFYGNILGCREGRSTEYWVDFNFFGHQLVAHLAPEECTTKATSKVDGHDVPCRHFGVVLNMAQWLDLSNRLKQNGIEFLIEPQIRFVGQPGEQATMFFLDSTGNALEFKAFADINQLFAK